MIFFKYLLCGHGLQVIETQNSVPLEITVLHKFWGFLKQKYLEQNIKKETTEKQPIPFSDICGSGVALKQLPSISDGSVNDGSLKV